ncbi:MAG: SagB/ThcOx family dehydrogenase [Methanoregula sp.]|nr:SagB/ThcOx family dehydrogenase [Methanoregula sp.]
MAIPITMMRMSERAGNTVVIAAGIGLAIIVIAGIFALSTPPAAFEKTVPDKTIQEETGTRTDAAFIPLPAPETAGTVSVEEALLYRRSVREYAATPLNSSDISRLLWAAQGRTGSRGFRTAPSAGALYPLEVFVSCTNVSGLPAGLYHYLPESHALEQVSGRDVREDLYKNALFQAPVRDAPAVIIIAADYNRTTQKYGERGIRYVHMEAGHAAENICLQAYALGIGTVTIGAFDDSGVRSVVGLPPEQIPLYLMPVGKVRMQTA